MANKIDRCVACLGSGKLLPECAPWDKFPGGECSVCSGHGYPNTVRLKSLHVGDLFQTINGREYAVIRKDNDGCVAADQSDASDKGSYWPHNPAVRVIRRADTALFLNA